LGCVTLTELPRGVSSMSDGSLRVAAIACDATRGAPSASAHEALDPAAIRIVTWNIHKQGDAGWERDLARFARDADLMLLQEAVLHDDLRALLDADSLRYTMASAFIYRDSDHGVVTASRVAPLAVCSERADEPLLRIPKAALIAWYPMAGSDATLAVVNLHAINFEVTLTPYQAQLAALVRVLAGHRGPMVFAGDFNTWSDGRRAALRAAGDALGLTEVPFDPDDRATFYGQQLDHVMVRGLAVTAAHATKVTSSDHNPVAVTLALTPR
jgi:endonuclease/exonuclease/phosphatase (EEP) superfamily protein YafD